MYLKNMLPNNIKPRLISVENFLKESTFESMLLKSIKEFIKVETCIHYFIQGFRTRNHQ